MPHEARAAGAPSFSLRRISANAWSIETAFLTSGRRAPCAASSRRTPSDIPVSVTPTPRFTALCARPSMVLAPLRVDERHGGEIDDQVALRLADALEHRAGGHGGPEEKRAGNPVDDHGRVLLQRYIIGCARRVVRHVLLGPQRHMCIERGRLRHPVDEQRRSEREADHDALGQPRAHAGQENVSRRQGTAFHNCKTVLAINR
jgi:hypothetical protein